MKRILSFKALALLVPMLACSITFCACSDDDDFTPQLEIGDNLLTEGIEAEIDGKIATISITSNADWTIDLPEAATSWVYLPVRAGKGKADVPVSIDPNFGSSAGRSTTLTVTAGGIVRQIPVTQVPTYNGQAVANDDETANHVQIAATKGVGMGLNLNSLKPYNNSVINFKAIEKLQGMDDVKFNLFKYDMQAAATARGAVTDSVDTKKDSLGVSLSFDINYATFKLHIGGAYHGDESKDHYQTEYRYGATYDVANASVDAASVVSLYDKASGPQDSYTQDEQSYMKCLLTSGFLETREWVEEALANNDTEEFDYAMEELVSLYGPVVISGCDLGGSISLWMKYDRDSIADIMRVDTAQVKLAVNTGILQVNANVEVSYKKEGITTLSNSAFKYQIAGGAKAAQDAVASVLSTKRQKGDADTVYGTLHDDVDKWISSIKGDDKSTLSYTRIQITPIWSFFKRSNRKAVKTWIEENCQDKLGFIENGYLDAGVDEE